MKNVTQTIVTCIIVVLAALISSPPAQAQWAVFDVSNFMQNLQQVQQTVAELNELRNQLEVARNQLQATRNQVQALTGSRGMGNIVTDTNTGYMGGMLSGNAQIKQLTDAIKKKAGYLSTQDLNRINDAYRQKIINSGDQAANEQAMSSAVFSHSQSEFQNIRALMDRIDTAKDPQAIQGLQARIQIEQANLQNQLMQAQAMGAMIAAKEKVQQEKDRQTIMSESMDYDRSNP